MGFAAETHLLHYERLAIINSMWTTSCFCLLETLFFICNHIISPIAFHESFIYSRCELHSTIRLHLEIVRGFWEQYDIILIASLVDKFSMNIVGIFVCIWSNLNSNKREYKLNKESKKWLKLKLLFQTFLKLSSLLFLFIFFLNSLFCSFWICI